MAIKNKGFDYFDEFAKLAKVCVEAAELLQEEISNWTNAEALLPAMEKMHEIENRGDEINRGVYRQCAKDFVTPIERDDLLTMAQNMDSVIDKIEDVLRSFYMYDCKFIAPGIVEFADLIVRSCYALDSAMGDFRNFKKSKDFRNLILAVNDCEEEGDRLYLQVMRDLHTEPENTTNPMRVMVWSRVFVNMEKCCDACEHVADTMELVMQRNS